MWKVWKKSAVFVLFGLALLGAMSSVSCVTPSTRRGSGVSACIANMKEIEPAKSTWALEHRRTNTKQFEAAKAAWAPEERELAQAVEQPDWIELRQLLGKPIAAKPVVDFVETHQLKKSDKGGSGSFTAP